MLWMDIRELMDKAWEAETDVNRQISNLCRIVFADRGLTGNPEVIPVQKRFLGSCNLAGPPCFQWNSWPEGEPCRKLTLMGYLPYLLRMAPLPPHERPATLSNSPRS